MDTLDASQPHLVVSTLKSWSVYYWPEGGICFDHPLNKGHGQSKRLKLLASSDPHFSSVEKLFYKGWKHPQKARPKIYAIFKVLSPEASLKPYLDYRERIGSSPVLRHRSKNPANEQLLFHGTNRSCRLGEATYNVRVCRLSKCHICAVICNSFDITKCGTKNKFRRFGNGIYTSSCSSKADDYVLNEDDRHARVLLVNRVVVGNPHRRRFNAKELTEPPCGHHSVIGEPGVDLNYEETVVYNNDAIRPAFLIVYGDKPEVKFNLQTLFVNLFKTPLAA